MRTINYDPAKASIQMIDQRLLPARFEILDLKDLDQLITAIKDMAVRGAPAIGIAAAFGVALAGKLSTASSFSAWERQLRDASRRLLEARPTAVNLRWGQEKIFAYLTSLQELDPTSAQNALDAYVQGMAEEDIEINRAMARHGARLLPDRGTVIHHCNTGALATVDYGTALGVIRCAHEMGKRIHVLVDETRPRLQGARLTAWELEQYGIGYDLICDGAAGYFLQNGEADAVLVGADRIACNGDVANKIGTYMLALAANASSVPFYCVAPRSTFDLKIDQGSDIPIEERDGSEILNLKIGEQAIVPAGASARNPAFDITPHHLISAFVTEAGLIHPPYRETIKATIDTKGLP